MTQPDANSPEAPRSPGYGLPPPVRGFRHGASGAARRSILGKIALALAIGPWLAVLMMFLLEPG
jgi:hypothetical protein